MLRLALELHGLAQDFFFGRFKDAIQAAEHRHGEDHPAVLVGPIGSAEEIRDVPDKADVFAEIRQGTACAST